MQTRLETGVEAPVSHPSAVVAEQTISSKLTNLQPPPSRNSHSLRLRSTSANIHNSHMKEKLEKKTEVSLRGVTSFQAY